MKTITAKFLTAILLTAMIPATSSKNNTGYLIATETSNGRDYIKTTSAATADSIVNFYLVNELEIPKQAFSVKTALEHTLFIELRTENITLYVERKEAFHDKKGNLKLKKLKQ